MLLACRNLIKARIFDFDHFSVAAIFLLPPFIDKVIDSAFCSELYIAFTTLVFLVSGMKIGAIVLSYGLFRLQVGSLRSIIMLSCLGTESCSNAIVSYRSAKCSIVMASLRLVHRCSISKGELS